MDLKDKKKGIQCDEEFDDGMTPESRANWEMKMSEPIKFTVLTPEEFEALKKKRGY